MQRQFTLMEDTLANFLPSDVRANRLRENIMARLDKPAADKQSYEDILNTPGLLSQRQAADVLLQRTSQGHFIANVSVNNTIARMLVDTGASTTAISDRKFSTIPTKQVEFLGLFNVNTAGGTIEAPIYKVKQLSVGEESLENISVLVLPSNNLSRFDGLLGMNVNRGQKILIRLRQPSDKTSFFPWEHLLGTMLHERGAEQRVLEPHLERRAGQH